MESKVNHLLGIFNKMGESAIHAHYDELLHSILKVSIEQGKGHGDIRCGLGQ